MEHLPNTGTRPKIIDSVWTFIVATACLGPFALPLLWRNPRYSKLTKILGSLVVCLLTGLLIWIAKVYIEPLMDEYKSLMSQPN